MLLILNKTVQMKCINHLWRTRKKRFQC